MYKGDNDDDFMCSIEEKNTHLWDGAPSPEVNSLERRFDQILRLGKSNFQYLNSHQSMNGGLWHQMLFYWEINLSLIIRNFASFATLMTLSLMVSKSQNINYLGKVSVPTLLIAQVK